MRLEQLYHLLEVAKYKSISLAAERTFVTQPAISSSISKLEDELGVILFKRTTQGAYPTTTGEVIIEMAQQAVDKIEEIKQFAKASELIGSISVATIPSMCDKIMPNVLSLLKKKHPNLDVSLLVGEPIHVLNNIQSGKAEIGIVILTEEIQGKDICFEELFSDEFLIYVGKTSPLWGMKSVSLQEALEHPVVAYNDEFSKNNGGITSILKKHGAPKISFRFDNLDIIKRVIAEGTFISFFPKFMSKDDVYLHSHKVVPIHISDVKLGITIGLIWSKRHSFSLAEKEFIGTLKSVCDSVVSEKSS